MPNLNLRFDGSTGPLLDLFVTVNTTEGNLLIEQGFSVPEHVFVGRALVDTGAGQTQIALSILEQLSLEPVSGEKARVRSATTGDGYEEMDVYSVNLLVNRPQRSGDWYSSRRDMLAEELHVVGSPKLGGLNVEMLLGRDVLSRCLLVYDGWNSYYTLAYEGLPQAAPDGDQGDEDDP